MAISENGLKRVAKDWSNIAKEPIEVEEIKGMVFGFGSELATLRIWRKYTLGIQDGRGDYSSLDQGYSKNLKAWYFSIETNL